jgi:hypothetical protein
VVLAPGISSAGGEAGEAALDPLLSWVRAQGGTIDTAERSGGAPLATIVQGAFAAPAIIDASDPRIELAGHATESAEVRAIAGRILDEISENGRSFRDFLVTIPPGGGPPPGLFRRIFAKARIPLVDGVGIPGLRTPGGRRALALVRAYEDSRPQRGSVDPGPPAPGAPAAPSVEEIEEAFVRARDVREAVERFRALHDARLAVPPAREVEEALDAMARVGGTRPLRPRDFALELRAMLSAIRVRDRGDDGVLLLTQDRARGLSRPVAFHAGLVRGGFRRSAAPDALLPDGIRAELSDLHAHRGRRLVSGEERRAERLLLARFALESSSDLALLSFAERDRVGGEVRNPSGLLLDVASERAGQTIEPASVAFRRLAPPRDPERARRRPADPLDADLARLTSGRATEEDLASILAEPRARHLGRTLRAAEARWGDPHLGAWDGVLADPRARAVVAAAIEGRAWSASALERMANCPFSFLLHRLGLPESGDEPDDFDPLERGKLFHDLIEDVYQSLEMDGLLPLEPAGLPEALSRLDDRVRRADRHLEPLPALARLHRRATLAGLRNDLALVLAREAMRPAPMRATPLHFELAFGPDAEGRGPYFPTPGGPLPVRGRVDRVDRGVDGSLAVVDFKTGRARAKGGALRAMNDRKPELQLQLPLYMEAVAQVLGAPVARAVYFHATADQGFREVEYTASDLARDREEVGRVLAHVVSRARDGWFPCTPGPGSCCRAGRAQACGPGVAERFAFKRADETLAAHVALVRGAAAAESAEEAP